jgi:hypothetical protein
MVLSYVQSITANGRNSDTPGSIQGCCCREKIRKNIFESNVAIEGNVATWGKAMDSNANIQAREIGSVPCFEESDENVSVSIY